MPTEKAQPDVEKECIQPQLHNRRRKFFRFSAYVLLALLGIKAVVSPFVHPHIPSVPHRRPSGTKRDELFLSVPNSESALAASRAYATHPHLAGSAADFEDARVILKLFQTEFGIEQPTTEPIFSAGTSESRNATLLLTSPFATKPSAWIDVYYPVLNTPLDRTLQILGEDGSAVWEANLKEDGDPLDEDASTYRDSVPTWHGLSRDGIAEGQLVYANYGSKADYDELVAAGADLTGKIVIVRYGAVFRGLKIKGAQELGAVGVLIYSDPRDDGYVIVENGFAPYPYGPARNPTSVQRGSVQYLSSYPGDPTTPGYPAYEHAQREEGTNIPKIPSLPISWVNGQKLLEEIGDLYVEGENGEKTLSGKASASKIKLVNHVDTKVTPIWNTMASIPGHIKDEVVIIGCHRDAWVLGAADPTSGTVSLHEVIRGFGALLRNGWKPLRTVVFASWDAEEYGLIGSTEWGEDFTEWISKHAVAYLNTDTSTSGSRWVANASPSLANVIKETALKISHPTTEGKNLWDAKDDEGPFQPASYFTIDTDFLWSYTATQQKLRASKTGISPLGSGSDFTVFLQRIGVASSSEGFGSTLTDAVYHYHSVYDTQRFQEVYADPGFHRHVAVARHLGLLALHLIDSFVIPLNTTQYALELDDYLDKVSAIQSESPSSFDTLDLSKLSKAIKKVQAASRALDKEKFKAEKHFKRILRKLHRHHSPHHHQCRKPSRFVRCVKDWIQGIFGVKPHNYQKNSRHDAHEIDMNAWTRFLEIDGYDVRAISPFSRHRDGSIPSERYMHIGQRGPDHRPSHRKPEHSIPIHPRDEFDHPEHPDLLEPDQTRVGPYHPDHLWFDHSKSFKHRPRLPKEIKKLIKAAKRIMKANKKIIAFERGFISEDGIRDREWYKHLGVAPGKWLGKSLVRTPLNLVTDIVTGYGATTFPALTEALAIDRNVTLAAYEAHRLTVLLEKLADTIEP
ncbi:hypothetical protein H2248_006431 [Termitomyces sp. 'cryptogamus']|nr:hypothetical protein H2248_006431 [Termitomyces sp. 'cryptogamus']